MKQRDRKKPKSARLQVSPRTVTSVTTHSVTTHNKGYKCHHAQQGRRNSENLSGPILPHPVIHPHSLHLHQTQSTGTREEHGDRLVKHWDRKRTKTCREEKRREKIRRYRAHVVRSPEEHHARHHYMRTGGQIPSPISRSLAN